VVVVVLEPGTQLKAGCGKQASEGRQRRLLPVGLNARHCGLRDASRLRELSLREAAPHPRQAQQIAS
jgi:hypothetical protein